MKVGTISPNGILFSEKNKNVFQLYPNPSREFVVCSLPFAKDTKIELIVSDLAGRILFSEKLETIKGKLETVLDMRNFSKGIYFVNIKTSDRSQTQKLIIE